MLTVRQGIDGPGVQRGARRWKRTVWLVRQARRDFPGDLGGLDDKGLRATSRGDAMTYGAVAGDCRAGRVPDIACTF